MAYLSIKKILDILFSIILILIFLPLMILVSIGIKLDSKGPVLFKQNRIGKNGIVFVIYKFRTMKIETPHNKATQLLDNHEWWITRLGKLLRRTSIDELPQLFNILQGKMSFVGPRPVLYNEYDIIEKRNSLGVHSILPGITGLAQVNGRDKISNNQKVEFDKYYLDNISFKLDLIILIKTFFNVILSKGVIG